MPEVSGGSFYFYFFLDYFLGFLPLLYRTAEDVTGKGGEREGMTCSKRAAGWNRTSGRRLSASVHGADARPNELKPPRFCASFTAAVGSPTDSEEGWGDQMS